MLTLPYRTIRTTALLACLGLTAASCSEVCIVKDGPKFETRQISDPVLNQAYAETITVEIQNEPNDDNFTYTFSVIGDLPPGIAGTANGRRYVLEGTPTAQGTYRFTVRVDVDSELILRPGPNGAETQDNDLCFLDASQTYEVVVR